MAGNKNSGFASHPELINREGRPKGSGLSLLTLLKNKLIENPDIVERILQAYLLDAEVDGVNRRDLLDRVDGKPTQPIEHSGELEGRLVINRGKPRKTSD